MIRNFVFVGKNNFLGIYFKIVDKCFSNLKFLGGGGKSYMLVPGGTGLDNLLFITHIYYTHFLFKILAVHT